MILFPKHKVAFVHFPKTAGRFITDLLTNKLKIPHHFIGNQHDPWSFHSMPDYQPIIVKREWKDVFRSYIEWKKANGNILCEPHIKFHPCWYIDKQLNAGNNTVHMDYFKFLEMLYYDMHMDNAIILDYETLYEDLSSLLTTVFKLNITAEDIAKLDKIK